MSLESVFANPPPLVGADLNETAKESDKESSLNYADCDTQPIDDDNSMRYGRSTSWATETSGQERFQGHDEDLEDGELEDGEIDDPDADGPCLTEIQPRKSRNSPNIEERSHHDIDHRGGASPHRYDKHDKSLSEEDSDDDERSRKRKKKKKKRDKKKDDKSKKKKRKYVDHDRVSDDYPSVYKEPSMSWKGYGSGRSSPPGPYDSPQYDSPPQGDRRPLPVYDDLEAGYPMDRGDHSPSGRSGYRRGGYKSPPGPYDSPSEDEGYGPPPKLQRYDSVDSSGSGNYKQRSMLSMLGEDMMDAGVAAIENEEMFQSQRGGGNTPISNSKKMRKASMYKEKQKQQEAMAGHEKKKRPLAATPMNERPQCYFYQEGKCQKGSDCQFNHDFELQKKFYLCKYYLNGYCTKGADCIYMHGDYPCKHFHLDGKCQKGNDCRFSHEELSPEHKEMFREQQLGNDEDKYRSPPHRNDESDYHHGDHHGDHHSDRGHDHHGNHHHGGDHHHHGDHHHGDRHGDHRNHDYHRSGSYHDDGGPMHRGPIMSSPPHGGGGHKKIPSIFDIEVFPPGKGPRPSGPPGMQGPPGPNMPGPPPGHPGPGPPPGMQSPQRQIRPRFYNDVNGPPPPGMPGPNQGGPGPGPPPPHHQPSLLGPPPVRFMRGMRPPHPGGPPPGPGMPPGPGPRGPGPMMGPCPPPGMGPMRPPGPGFFNGNFYGGGGPDMPFDGPNPNGDFPNNSGPNNMDTDERQANLADNMEMLAGLDPNSDDVPAHLPPKQRALFMRIKQQQRDNNQVDNIGHGDQDERGGKVENWYSSDEDESSPNKILNKEDPNLVSSLWSSLKQQSSSSPNHGMSSNQPQGAGVNPANMSQFDIAQMINSIRTMSGTGPNQSPSGQQHGNTTARDPRQKSDPRLARKVTDPRMSGRGGASQTTPSPVHPGVSPPPSITQPQEPDNIEVDGSIAIQTKQGKRVLYILRTIDFLVRATIPSSVNMNDDKFKDDPRIQKALNKLDPRKARADAPHKLPSVNIPIKSPPIQSPPGDVSKSLPEGERPPMPKSLTVPPGGDPRLGVSGIQRTISAPMGITLEAPAKPLDPPSMPDALKERPNATSRRSSSEHATGAGDISPRGKDSNALAYRNDPRYRKKKVGASSSVSSLQSQDSSESPSKGNGAQTSNTGGSATQDVSSNDSSKDSGAEGDSRMPRRGMEYSSPLASKSDAGSESSGGYGFYNRPPNDNFQQFQEQQKKAKNNRGGVKTLARTVLDRKGDTSDLSNKNNTAGSSDGGSPGESLMYSALDSGDQIQTEPVDESSLRDMFQTKDPTASPFC